MYDSRTDRAVWPNGHRYNRSWNGRGGKAIKRQTNKKLRRMELTRQHEMFGKRVYCKCCCTSLC